MIAAVIADRKTAKGKTGGTLTKESLDVWRTKLGHVSRILGDLTPLSAVDHAAVGRFLDRRDIELKEAGRDGQHTRSKELGCLRLGLRLMKVAGAYPHDVDYVTRKGRFAVGYKPRRRHLTWDEIPKLLGGLLQEDPKRVSAETIAKARRLKACGMTLAEIGAEIGKAISTVKRYLDLPDSKPVRGGEVRAKHAAWYIATGGRDAESHRAELADHDFETWRVRIRGTKTGEADAVIPIAPPFRTLLLFATADRPTKGPLFPPWTNVGRSLKLACKRAGIPPVSPNDLRRTHFSLLKQAGIHNDDLAKIARHTTTRMMDAVYGVTTIDALGRALEKVPAGRPLLPPDTSPSPSSKKGPK